MIDKNLIPYIQECLKRGYDISYIQNSLINNGHNPQNVYDTINSVLNQNPKNTSETSKQIAGLPEEKKPKISKKTLIYIAIGLGIVALIIVIFLFLLNTNKISNKKLSQGTTFDLKKGKQLSFTVDNTEHKIELTKVNSNSADFLIYSRPLELTLEINEEKKLDLDYDDFYDLKIKLNSISQGIPRLYIVKINEEICYEDWDCEEWSNCSESGMQTRTCEDLNDCGTIKDKPLTSRTCTYVPPCDENWTCEDWGACINGVQSRNCTDLNDCGTIENQPNTSRTCEAQQIIDCGDVTNSMNNCFINASLNCTPAKITKKIINYQEPMFGMFLINNTELLEIHGWNSTNCSYSTTTLLYSQVYNQDTIKYYSEEENLTQEQIQQQEQEANQSSQTIVGVENFCDYNQEGLTAMLEYMQENNGSITGQENDCNVSFDLTGKSVSECVYNNVTAISYCQTLNQTD